MKIYKFTLTKPPSTNQIYGVSCRSGRAIMYMYAEGKAWCEEAMWAIKTQCRNFSMIEEECEVYIDFTYAIRNDVDGIIKPCLDVMQKVGLIKNDSLITYLTVSKEKCKKGEEKVEIEIREYK